MAKADLQLLAGTKNLAPKRTVSDIVKQLLQCNLTDSEVDSFIKKRFIENVIQPRQQLISGDDLRAELEKVKEFSWGAVQGGLDAKIQRGFVRIHPRYDELVAATRSELSQDVTSYVVCTWYNHWTTVIFEETIYLHPKVVPALRRNIAGLDFFFCNQPFDLKVTYLPKDWLPQDAIKEPQKLCVWLYENQGEERFSAHNRFYVVLFDQRNPVDSWKLKRDFALLTRKSAEFFDKETVSLKDELIFTYKHKGTFTAISKLLLIYR